MVDKKYKVNEDENSITITIIGAQELFGKFYHHIYS